MEKLQRQYKIPQDPSWFPLLLTSYITMDHLSR